MTNFATYKKHIPKKKKEAKKDDKIPKIDMEKSRWERLLSLMSTIENKAPQEPPTINVVVEPYQMPLEQKPELKDDPEIKGFQRVRDYYNNEQADINAEIAYNYLTGDRWGFSPIMASGIIGNLYHENLANPSQTVNDSHGTTSFGIAGFNSNGLLNELENYANKYRLDKNDIITQLSFIADYIVNGRDPNLTREMFRPDLTPEHASFVFGKYFERFAGRDGTGRGHLNYNDDEHDRRRKRSVLIHNKYNKSA